MTIQLEHIVDELHECILDLYDENVITFHNSCHKIIIQTAFYAFSKLNLINMKGHKAKNGQEIVFLSTVDKSSLSLKDKFELFHFLKPVSEQDQHKIYEKIENACYRAQGDIPKL